MDCAFYGVDVAAEVVYKVGFKGTTGFVYILLSEREWLGYVERAMDSTSSTTRFAATMKTGDPIAVPSIFW